MKSRVALKLSAPVSQEDVARHADALSLSPTQREFFQSLYERYSSDVNAALARDLPAIQSQSEAAAETWDVGRATFAAVRASEQLHALETKLQSEVVDAERRFFEALRPALDEQQLGLMERVRASRDRKRCPRHLITIPSARLDLSEFVEGQVDDVSQIAGVDPILLEYENSATPLYRSLADELWNREMKILHTDAFRMSTDDDQPLDVQSVEGKARDREGWLRKRSILEAGATLELKIAHLNAAYLPRLLERLDQKTAHLLLTSYLAAAFRPIHPNPHSSAKAHELAMAAVADDKELAEAIAALWSINQERCQSLEVRMQNLYEAYKSHQAGSSAPFDGIEYRLQMRELREERWKSTLAYLSAVRPLVPANLQQTIEEEVDVIERARIDAAHDLRWPGP